MGNTALQRDYNVSEKVSATGGNDHLWRIYPAAHKTSKQEVSVFMTTRKEIETQFGIANANNVLNRLKLEAQLLAQLRHPNILNLHSLHVEGAKEVYMVTEPILGSLSNLLKDYKNLPDPLDSVKKFQFFPVELRVGMCQIAEALEYCHNELKLAHLNISPENIYITPQGAWKLAGFNFSFFESYQRATEVQQVIVNNKESVVKFGPRLQKGSYLPSLNYSAPEYVLGHQPSLVSDIFSFGVLYYDLCRGMNSNRGLLFSSRNIEIYKQRVQQIRELNFEGMAKPMADSLYNTLSENPQTRLEIHTILRQMSLFGNDVNALRILGTISMRDTASKAKFLKPLPQVLQSMPERVLRNRVLPLLLDELRDVKTATFALPSIFVIAEKMNNKQYGHFILPQLSKVFMQMQPSEIPLKLLENFKIMMDKSSPSEQENFMLPFLVRCLELGSSEVQIEAMKQIEKCLTDKQISAKDFISIFLPKIDTLVKKTNSSLVRTNGAVCLGKASANLEEKIQVQVIIPCLEHCLKVDSSSALVMTVVGVLSRISKMLSHKHIVALRILPSVIPIAVNTSLTEDQFLKYMKAVKSMMVMVEQQRLEMFANASTLAKETEERRFEENKKYESQRYDNGNNTNLPPPPSRNQSTRTNGGPLSRQNLRTNDFDGEDDLFGPPRSQTKPKSKPQQMDDFLVALLPTNDMAERDSRARTMNKGNLFGDMDDVAESLLSPAEGSSPPSPRKSTAVGNIAPVEDNHLDDLMNRFMGHSALSSERTNVNGHEDLLGEPNGSQEATVSTGNDNLFKNLGDEWKSNVLASEKLSPPRKQLSHKEEKGTASPLPPPPATSDFDNLLDRVALDHENLDDNDDDDVSHSRTKSSSKPLFDEQDPFSRINIADIDDDDDDEVSSSAAFKSSAAAAATPKSSLYNNSSSNSNNSSNDINKHKKSYYDDEEEDFDLGGGNISEMMASLGESTTPTTRRTKSYFDDDEEDNSQGHTTSSPSGQGAGGDLDDLMSRFM